MKWKKKCKRQNTSFVQLVTEAERTKHTGGFFFGESQLPADHALLCWRPLFFFLYHQYGAICGNRGHNRLWEDMVWIKHCFAPFLPDDREGKQRCFLQSTCADVSSKYEIFNVRKMDETELLVPVGSEPTSSPCVQTYLFTVTGEWFGKSCC